MQTNNLKKWLNAIMSQTGFTLKRVDGTDFGLQYGTSWSYSMSWQFTGTVAYDSLSNACSIYVGTGNTTPEAETNYALDNVCTDCSNDTGSAVYDGSTGVTTFTKTFTYRGTEPIEIKEIGLFKSQYYYQNNMCLLAREVLENPISVSNGDTFTVTMVIG